MYGEYNSRHVPLFSIYPKNLYKRRKNLFIRHIRCTYIVYLCVQVSGIINSTYVCLHGELIKIYETNR